MGGRQIVFLLKKENSSRVGRGKTKNTKKQKNTAQQFIRTLLVRARIAHTPCTFSLGMSCFSKRDTRVTQALSTSSSHPHRLAAPSTAGASCCKGPVPPWNRQAGKRKKRERRKEKEGKRKQKGARRQEKEGSRKKKEET